MECVDESRLYINVINFHIWSNDIGSFHPLNRLVAEEEVQNCPVLSRVIVHVIYIWFQLALGKGYWARFIKTILVFRYNLF